MTAFEKPSKEKGIELSETKADRAVTNKLDKKVKQIDDETKEHSADEHAQNLSKKIKKNKNNHSKNKIKMNEEERKQFM